MLHNRSVHGGEDENVLEIGDRERDDTTCEGTDTGVFGLE